MPRQAVIDFTAAMEEKLIAHDDGKDGWMNNNTTVRFLKDQLNKKHIIFNLAFDDCDRNVLKNECVNIANYAMMIFNRLDIYDE